MKKTGSPAQTPRQHGELGAQSFGRDACYCTTAGRRPHLHDPDGRCPILPMPTPIALTAALFEAEYAIRSGLSVLELRDIGRVVKRCRCGAAGCRGWQSISADNAAFAEELYAAGGRRPDWLDQ